MENEQVLTERTWLGAFVALVAALAVGSLVATERVYDRFIWRYFWGPIYSDANNARCAVLTGDGIDLLGSTAACQTATGVVAETGYTTVSTFGYMAVLVFMLGGVYLLLDRLDVGGDKRLFLSLVPFMLFGGAVRVVEDATDAAVAAGTDPVISYPLNVLFISPVIYVTVFLITLAALLASLWLESRELVRNRYRALAGFGLGVLALTLGYLFFVAFTREYVSVYPQILLVDVGLASVLAYLLYVGADRYEPEINAGTGIVGLGILWAHAIDGVANVVAADWLPELGHPIDAYGAKHVANRAIIDVTQTIQPASLSAAIGTSWPFLFVKLAVALGIVWLFDERIFDESPRYAVLLLVAAAAVGLGPGTRDILRVTFAI
ncbi:hypothetical protein C475_11365 [Halosimplex carlsbadense 2-9-1]|uniref:DUF63 family protein n=1 Tax=Halosimplex carlsbadense 2-9-1 TaxID=797114 RepID=M0CR00_9EURY|nr:DUF63 family protein [Halosimplex carlsbadense]ELZ24832.1 hypothetical protein C475_11365 [Halosimplex carlsbadense 2-9-1]